MRKLELLAPARDAAIAREAILHGADAVYIGGPSHGARAAAANSIADIAALTVMAHLYGARVYVTLNTIIYDDELAKVEQTIRDLYNAGVDALIVQDMGILRMDIPPIDLHASTQCDIRTPEKARFLASCGFSQLVLPREMSLDEIRAVREAVPEDVALEAFVHGALCVSYSGDCQASALAKGRSANRGECAQMCRLPYSLIDADGNVLVRDKHLLSLRDLNRLQDLTSLIEAGISSFKIEGRLKDAAYVKQTVAAYRKALDQIIAYNPDRYCRSSWGDVSISFTPDLSKAFNRGFTPYFLNGSPSKPLKMANLDTPKWVGQKVGKVTKNQGLILTAQLYTPLNNGDGLGYYDPVGNFKGFRVNRADGDRLHLAQPVDILPGTIIYRNRDTKSDALLAQQTATRLIPVDMSLAPLDGETAKTVATGVSSSSAAKLTVTARIGSESVETSEEVQCDFSKARTPQKAARARALAKLGGTAFSLGNFDDQIPDDVFVPLSVITDLRQRAVQAITDRIIQSYSRRERKPEDPNAKIPHGPVLTYHDNVSNRLAREFYSQHGASEIEDAIELRLTSFGATPRLSPKEDDYGVGALPSPKDNSSLRVMTTRYCLRRELGACLCDPNAKKLPQPLFITNDTATYRLDFDCKNCRMRLYTAKKR